MSATLEGLLSRIEAATGPFDRIEAQQLEAASPWARTEEGFLFMQALVGGVPAIGCALALVARVLPGRRVNMECGENYSSARFVKGWGGRREPGPASERPDNELPLAILAALVRALIAKAGG